MVSPYVRRQQLSIGLIRAREAAGLTHAQVGAHIGQQRQKISRLENGHVRPVPAEIFKILELYNVTGDEWANLVQVANEAADQGWWTSYGDDMGPRQALYADLESGAELIREFQPFIPGLLQTVEFAQHRRTAGAAIGPVAGQTARAVEARQTRQKMLLRPGGPSYEVVLDEIAVRRLPAPPAVVAAQVRHLIELTDDPDVTVRILPVDAVIRDYAMPRTAFSVYRYPGPLDPQVVAVDTITSDLVLTSLAEEDQVNSYTATYERLAEAALPREASITFLATVANQLPKGA